uniref:Laminin subunit alpha 3 n=1 Tax=Hucho hucho TaxID=62062 RepID=A0A4W5KZX3_9TELE
MARWVKRAHPVALLFTFMLLFWRDVYAQVSFNEITGFSLSPPYFNLAEGSRISATATCGEDEAGRPRSDLYCKLVGGPTFGLPSQTIQGQYCDRCNSNEPNKAHPVSNAIDGTEGWWQSPPLSRGPMYNEVNVTLDLGQLFHVAYILIKFANAPRPDLWVLERSLDHGKTYAPWQYFAHSKRECIERFGKEPNGRIVRDDDQICTTEYSKIVPLENGEIVVSLVNGRPGSKNFTYSPVLRDFTKATNIRLHFLRTSTLLGHLISKAQRDPTVTRRYYYSIKDISVGGRCVCHGHAEVCGGFFFSTPVFRLQCECKHNTCGESCDRCCPGFNQKPWRAATTDSPNQCQPCQCHSHATECYYDPEVEQMRASLDTFGRYDGGGVCINCQHNTAGVNCELCADGFYRPHGLPPESHSGCIPCRCDARTTAGCEMGTGRCHCRPEFTGNNCERCADSYYGYPHCISIHHSWCVCDRSGSVLELCDASGRCICRDGVEGERCDRCQPGHHSFPNCQECVCDGSGSVLEMCDASGRCVCRGGVEGERCDRCRPGYHSFPNCQVCRCDGAGVTDRVCGPNGQCRCRVNYFGSQCDLCAPGYYGYPDCACTCFNPLVLTAPMGGLLHLTVPLHVSLSLACQCLGEGSYDSMCNPVSGQCLCRPGVVGQQCDRCAGSGLRFPQCSGNPSGSCGCLPNVEGTLCDMCKPLYWNLATENPSGCIGCQCDVGGAIGRGCDEMSGQCQCRKNVVGRTCTDSHMNWSKCCSILMNAPNYYFPSLHHLRYEVEDGITPNARPVRFGYDPQTFPGFSWRGYAIMSPAQPEVILSLAVGFPGPFHIMVRYVTTTSRRPTQGKEMVFPSSSSPAYLTVPGDGFAEPFTLTPGKWIIRIRAEGLLLDYLVLLPSDYYEAPFLQENIAQPLYAVPAEEFSMEYLDPKVLCVSVHGRFTEDSARVPVPGRYVFVVHFCQPEHTTFPVEVRVDAGHTWAGSVNASFCPGVSCCREVVIAERRIALDLPQQDMAISLKVPPGKTLTLDYILVVPDDSYTPDLLKEKPFDKSSDFTRQCGGPSFSIDPRTSSQFCRDSARSLVAAYSDGALPCYCDKSGATGPTCNPVGGQCPCRPHVIGRQCTRCATGYYGFPYCRPCECGQRLCHEVTGQCICPPQTVKPVCDVCESQTFSYHPLVGCEGCDCSPNGVRPNAGRECDRDTGQCTCKPRIGGRQCDRCAAGFYRFPECVPCNCNQGGVTPDVCHPDTGQCLCKRNVRGARCDACRDGSFHFDPSHPKGCISCFCFGATDQCLSSGKRRGKFMDMRGWRLERVDQEEVASVLNPSSNTVVADVQELPGTTQVLHWVAPPSYLVDRVSSYGGYLTYQAKSFGIPSEGMSLMDRRPDVLLSGQDMTLVHMAPHPPNPDRLHQGRVQLVEGNWRHAGTNRPVSREDLMEVLAGLVGLRVRALYFTQSQRLSLGEVGLEEATNTGAGGPASTVEECACSPLYRGDSCQKCARGYYRDGSGPYLGRCVPCFCNGLSNECDDRTGRCLNCQYNTAGDRCERCKEGYYGDAAQRSCRVCPCPFSVPANSFAVGCREVAGGFQCVCRPGYTGDRCERCVPGYYGDPLTAGGSCRPCDCSGNGNSCDSRTGGELLDYIKANVTKQYDQNEAAAKRVKGLLKGYEDKLKDLDEALKQAGNMVKKANSQNGLNSEALKDILVIINLPEYEQLAAQLDGARTDLTKKVNTMSQAAAKEDIVERAEKHAENLAKLAKELQDTVCTVMIVHSFPVLFRCEMVKRSNFSLVMSLPLPPSTVKNLLNTIPSLQDKISEVEELSSQLSPVTNVSDNINRIKELIEQARDAANRIVVPMKFSGDGHVELRPPRDIEDLKAYTSLSLSLQRPEIANTRGDGAHPGDMFVLYLGNQDVSGLDLVVPILLMKKKMDDIDLTIFFWFRKALWHFSRHSPNTCVNVFIEILGELTRNLLNLDPRDIVFYVGGYPSNFTPPASLNYPNYKGCIELSTFNDRFISLYNFKNAVKINQEIPCKRYIQPVVFEYYEGTGYAKVSTQGVKAFTLLLGQTISTRSENGLFLYIGNEVGYLLCSH